MNQWKARRHAGIAPAARRALAAIMLIVCVAGWGLFGGRPPVVAAEPHRLSVAFLVTGSPCTEAAAKGPNTVTSVTANGSAPMVICVHVESVATGTSAQGVPLELRVLVGTVGASGTARYSGFLFSTAAGTAQISYRGDGASYGTDTVVVTFGAGNAVATDSIEVTPGVGLLPATITVIPPPASTFAAAVTGDAGYASPARGVAIALRVRDWKGLGVNGHVMRVSVDRGAVAANPAFALGVAAACATAAPSILLTSSSTDVETPGGPPLPGSADFVVCGLTDTAPGDVLVTIDSISQPLPRETIALRQAGRPARIETETEGVLLRARVTDAAGRGVADGTPVRFVLSPAAGVLSASCALTRGGAAVVAFGLDVPSAVVLVTADYHATGAASTCAMPGTRRVDAAATVVAPSPTPLAPPAEESPSAAVPAGAALAATAQGRRSAPSRERLTGAADVQRTGRRATGGPRALRWPRRPGGARHAGG